MRRAEAAAAACIVVLFTLCGAAFACAGLLSGSCFYGNISVEGASMGGKTLMEAQRMFAGMEKMEGTLLDLTVDGKEHTVSAVDIGARRNVSETVEAAWSLGRTGGIFTRLSDIFSLREHPRGFAFQTAYDDGLLKAAADGIAQGSALPAHNAALQFLPLSDPPFAYIREAEGRQADPAALYAGMKAGLDGSGPSAFSAGSSPLLPEVSEADIRAETQLIGSFTTALIPDAVRSRNIELAGEAVNGAVIWPGGEFSFNGRTGGRTKEKGYAGAAAIAGGRLVDETGGGVCQVATTVYNAALLSGLTIVERNPHSRPMYYVDAGRDATVDFDSKKDLRLRNDSSAPVYLIFRMDGAGQLITAEFYGIPSREAIGVALEDYKTVMPGRPVEIANEDRPIGWSSTLIEARPGCSVSVYRVYSSGASSRKELVSKDFYPPQQGRTEIGTMPPEGENK